MSAPKRWYVIEARKPAIYLPALAETIHQRLQATVMSQRGPDFIVGADSPGGAYLLRWFLSPWKRLQVGLRNQADAASALAQVLLHSKAGAIGLRVLASVIGWLPNLYLHEFRRDDDDRAHHDHPSWAICFMLTNSYIEHTIDAGGIHRRRLFSAGSLRFMRTLHVHRIELLRDADGNAIPCRTLFLFGPALREWGFHCPERGWVHWRIFTATGKPGEIGRGCDA